MKLYYYLYRKFNHIPCREEVLHALNNNPKISAGIRVVAEKYAFGIGLDTIALEESITRERTRQYLCKAVRKQGSIRNQFICFARSTSDINGRPKGFVWMNACFTDRNYRLFPIGYRR
jgi:hypothetical protein